MVCNPCCAMMSSGHRHKILMSSGGRILCRSKSKSKLSPKKRITSAAPYYTELRSYKKVNNLSETIWLCACANPMCLLLMGVERLFAGLLLLLQCLAIVSGDCAKYGCTLSASFTCPTDFYSGSFWPELAQSYQDDNWKPTGAGCVTNQGNVDCPLEDKKRGRYYLHVHLLCYTAQKYAVARGLCKCV